MPMMKCRAQPRAAPVARCAEARPSAVLRTCPIAILGRPTEGSTSNSAVMTPVAMSPAAAARAEFMALCRSRLGLVMAHGIHVGGDQKNLRLGDAAWVWHHERARKPVVHPIDDGVIGARDVAPARAGERRGNRSPLKLVSVTARTGSFPVKDLPACINHFRREHRGLGLAAFRGGVHDLRLHSARSESHSPTH